MITNNPSIYTMDHPDLNVLNVIEISSGLKRVQYKNTQYKHRYYTVFFVAVNFRLVFSRCIYKLKLKVEVVKCNI